MTVVHPPAGRRVRRKPVLIAVGVVVGLLILLGLGSTVYTELLWFQETGFEDVFRAGILVRLGLGAVFGAIFAALVILNLWIVKKITSPARLFTVPDQILERYRQLLQPYMKWAVIGGAILFGIFAGSGASVVWQEYLLFDNAVDFGRVDPVFGKDIGFFVFRLPFHRFLFTWGFSTLVVITIITAFAHYFMGGIRPQGPGDRVAPEARAHLSVLVGLIVLLKAWGYRLDQFDLLFSGRGTVTGASYTDVNAQFPALRLMIVIAIAVALFFFVNARFKNWLLPIGGIALLALTSIIAGGVWPAFVQRFQVTPNEQRLEAEFIDRNIGSTQAAYGIDEVEQSEFAASQNLERRAIDANPETIENIRLWDPRVLRNNYLQLQRVKQYYEFLDVDVDRYSFGEGDRRLVMLSAREVEPMGLDAQAQTWLNRHLVYTHGYGAVASRVDRVTREGQPSFIVQNIPPVSIPAAPELTQPRIYYGETDSVPFSVVNTEQPELDFPQGDTFVPTTYAGEGGVELSSIFRRAAFAWRFRDVNLLISGALDPESRILFRRNVLSRVQAVAPFLRVDLDPYIAVIDGRLVWIVDAYTTTDQFPYSERLELGAAAPGAIAPLGSVNYIRNSVKFVIDAEHGSIDGYVWDEEDPIIRAWQQAFPTIFKPRSEMSEDLLAHVRYPEGLFKVQTERYAVYHIEDASNFYSKEDAWRIAMDPTAPGVTPPPVDPYFLMLRLPREDSVDFVSVRPFTPRGRQNLTAYMIANSDCLEPGCPGYGKLRTLVFPKEQAILGPEQVFARINQDPIVSQQVSLWERVNSSVIYGNLLIIPIEDSLLYVQPLFLQGESSQLPELKRVVVVSGEDVRMADSLERALLSIFGEAEPQQPRLDDGIPSGDEASSIEEALRHFEAARQALQAGDLAGYQREINAAEEALREGRASPSPAPDEAG